MLTDKIDRAIKNNTCLGLYSKETGNLVYVLTAVDLYDYIVDPLPIRYEWQKGLSLDSELLSKWEPKRN